jgi:hypothetical protein
MREYSPKRRTAVVFTGSGTAGAYHAGVLKALDESGVKIDVVSGSGVGVVAATFAAVAGGPQLYGPGGFWDGVGWSSLYRLRWSVRALLGLFLLAFVLFLFPLLIALLIGVLAIPVLLLDLVIKGLVERLVGELAMLPQLLRSFYTAALSIPSFAVSLLALAFALRALVMRRRRAAELLEALLDTKPLRERLLSRLSEVARMAGISEGPAVEEEISRRYVAALWEGLEQPGFRELILRVADLDSGQALVVAVLREGPRTALQAMIARSRQRELIDLTAPSQEGLFCDTVLTGLLPPGVAPLRRYSFPKGSTFAGETHRLAESTLTLGTGLAEAIGAGAEQLILVTATPEDVKRQPRRRGFWGMLEGILATLERQSVESDIEDLARSNRIIETLGHEDGSGCRAWQDPVTGHVHRAVDLYVIRPQWRGLGLLQFDGVRDPVTEVVETPKDLLDQGYRDAYRCFVEPVVGAVSAVTPPGSDDTRPMTL